MSEQIDFEQNYYALKRLHESANLVIGNLQKDNEEKQNEITLLNAKLINCQNALDITKTIMGNALTEQNKIKDEYTNEIKALKEKIKLLEIEG